MHTEEENHIHEEIEKPGVAILKMCYIDGDEFCSLFMTPLTEDGNYAAFRLTQVTRAELEILYEAESPEEMEMLCGHLLRKRRHTVGIE